MPTFKEPTTPSGPKLRTPMKAKPTPKKDLTKKFTVADFEDMNRNGSVFFDGGEEKFLTFAGPTEVLQTSPPPSIEYNMDPAMELKQDQSYLP